MLLVRNVRVRITIKVADESRISVGITIHKQER